MKILQKICLFTATVALLFSMAVPGALAVDAPDVSIDAALVVEKESGKILYERNIHEIYESEELARLMTLLLAAEAIENNRVSEDDLVTATDSINLGKSSSAPNVNIEIGETLSLYDLIYCVQLTSASDAANAIAVHIAGSFSSFVDRMNSKAKELGCENTFFVTPNGLEAEGQHTTVWDTYLIVSAAMSFPLLDSVLGDTRHTVPVTNISKKRVLNSENELMLTDSNHYSEYCTSGHFGISTNGNCMLAVSSKNDELSLTSVGIGNDADILFEEIKMLSEWGLSNFSWRTVIDSNSVVHICDVKLGDGNNRVKLAPSSDITMLLENNIPDTAFDRNIIIYAERAGEMITAPVSIGDVLGEMTVTLNGEKCGSVKLVSASNIDMMRSAYLKIALKDALKRPSVIVVIIFVILMFITYFIYAVIDAKRRRIKKAEFARIKRGLIAEHQSGAQPSCVAARNVPADLAIPETVTIHDPYAQTVIQKPSIEIKAPSVSAQSPGVSLQNPTKNTQSINASKKTGNHQAVSHAKRSVLPNATDKRSRRTSIVKVLRTILVVLATAVTLAAIELKKIWKKVLPVIEKEIAKLAETVKKLGRRNGK